VTGGEKVYPREVEEMLFQLPEVSDAAVFDLPDNRWVQMVVAAVVLKNGSAATPDDIIAQLKKRLASYKCPKQIFIATALPKNGAGKLLRKVLRTTYANHGGNGR
jgi:acyl-CoA synthetase (AMP-forming)/AMP-acid ligase II